MRTYNEELHERKKVEIMEKCYDCYAEYGFGNANIRDLGKACGLASGSLYTYFEDLDDLVISSTEHCMTLVEDEFMAKAPTNLEELERFIDEIPYWTAEHHGKKYRLMYQIYTNPKYIEYGKKFFDGVNERYTEYAKQLESKIGLSHTILVPFIFILIRACVHYAMFNDEYYLKAQISVLKKSLQMFLEQAKKDQQQ